MSGRSSERYQKKDTTPKQRQRSSGIPFENYRFCRIELTEAEKDDLRADYLPNASPIGIMTDLAIPGYKFSYTLGDDGKTHLVSLTCRAVEDVNAGLTITARGGDVSKAIVVLGYKVLILCGERAWREVEHERGGRYDDIG